MNLTPMFSRGYKRYALAIMTAAYTLSFVDRGLVALLLEEIKKDLQLSDTQLGLLTGILFGVFYAVAGIPIARLADRRNRVMITSLAIGVWGMTLMGCLFVSQFIHMAFARMAAAVGEAGCKPPTYSLVGDYFPGPAERARAMSVYMTAVAVAAPISWIVGGWLNELYGWRMTFFLIGIPGLLLAVLIKLTLVEPRTRAPVQQGSLALPPPLTRVFAMMWGQASLRHLCIGLVLLYMMSVGLSPWYAAFMIRSHHMETSELGIWIGLIYSVGGISGTLLGGFAAAHWFSSNERGQVRMSAVTVACLVPCFVAFLTLPQKHHALIALFPLVVVFSVFLGPTYALMQRLVPDEMRATMMAVVMLLANFIGFGLGPQFVGIVSDQLRPLVQGDSLRYAMLLLSLVAIWAAYHFWRVGRTVEVDLKMLESSTDAPSQSASSASSRQYQESLNVRS